MKGWGYEDAHLLNLKVDATIDFRGRVQEC